MGQRSQEVFSDSCSNPKLIARTMAQSAEQLVQRKIVRAEDVSDIQRTGIGLLGQMKL